MSVRPKIKKRIKWTIGSVLGLCLLFFIVLVVHIAVMVKLHSPKVDRTIQMARVDFKQAPDSHAVKALKAQLALRVGIKSTFYNPKTHIMIYTFDNRLNNAQNIYETTFKGWEKSTNRYIVTASDMNKGCPVINQNSFYGHLTAMITKVIY